jgi:hypothetical protein
MSQLHMRANGTKCISKSARETAAKKKKAKKGNLAHATGRQ